MKKLLVIMLAFLTGVFIFLGVKPEEESEYLRIHIRANSNLAIDQNVKYEIKDEIVKYLTPVVLEVKDKKDAETKIKKSLSEIEAICDRELEKNGFNYKSKARINNEKFPTRTYLDYTLEEGYYDALIIELGEGKGDNWWCVVYPPLCFTGENVNYIYRSKIAEIIGRFYT